ncbi:hypothetical protein L3Q82_025443 [Scortum barcoo]|uniref:Uncharacterized protein n=1 Tax=Scortum barcoo TaxID=214431 RepID=A0ACB8WMY8_9TELE|nr:hypothetical protein L3Q82_025443 [Scortum barcoo]
MKVLGDNGARLRAVHKPIMNRRPARTVTSPRIGVTGAPPWSQVWGWGCRRAPGGRVFAHTGPGRAQPEMATWARLPVGRLTRRKIHEGPVQCGLGSSRGGGLDDPIPGPKLWQ